MWPPQGNQQPPGRTHVFKLSSYSSLAIASITGSATSLRGSYLKVFKSSQSVLKISYFLFFRKCNQKYQDIQALRFHVKNHFKESWPLPKTRPYICPECYYEAHTYLSLFKHVGMKHGDHEFKKIYKEKPVGQIQQPEPVTTNVGVQIQVRYFSYWAWKPYDSHHTHHYGRF